MLLSRMSKVIGIKGLYLSMCKSLKINPMRISIPIFGVIRKYHEITSIHDNFGIGEIRDEKIEAYLKRKKNPLVVDCGVNVGITVRWWFSLNDTLEVIGIDMIEETHEFTIDAIRMSGIAEDRYRYHTAALWKKSGVNFTISIDDPLLSVISLYEKRDGERELSMTSKTLDEIFSKNTPEKISLLKIDLEGAGADALEGANKTLGITQHVCFEYHGEDEYKKANKILSESGFILRKNNYRHLWWEKH